MRAMNDTTLDILASEIDRYGRMDFEPTWDQDGEWPEYSRLDDASQPDKPYEAMVMLESCIRTIRSIAWSPTGQTAARDLIVTAQGHLDRIAAENGLLAVRP